MEGSNPLLPQQSSPAAFGGSANALARLGRPLPGPFAHFASPIAPYTIPSFTAGPQQPPNPQMFPDTNNPLHSTLASMAAYSFDSLLSANFNNFANLLMMGPNNPNVSLGAIQPPLLGAFGNQPHPHSPSPTSSSPSPNYFRRDISATEPKLNNVSGKVHLGAPHLVNKTPTSSNRKGKFQWQTQRYPLSTSSNCPNSHNSSGQNQSQQELK